MAPRKGESNELKRFLLAHRESVVGTWLARLLSKSGFRRKLVSHLSEEEQTAFLTQIYDSLIPPLSLPTKTGKTRKVRLKKAHRENLSDFSLLEIQQAQLFLLDILRETVRRHYSKKPKKIEKLSALISERMHDLLLQTAGADVRRHARDAAQAERKYSRLLEAANDAIFLLDFETGLFVEANEAACELTGYSESEIKEMGLNALTSVFDLNRALEQAYTAIETGAARFDDISIRTKKGAVVPVDISASGVSIDGTGHVFAIVRDIKERKAFERKLSEKAERLQLVNEIAHAISSADLDIETVLTMILEGVARVISVEAGSVLRFADGELTFMVALGEKAEHVKPFRLREGQGIAGWVAETGENLIVHDVHKDPRYFPDVEKATGFVTKSILAVPMKTGDEIIGVIELINKVGGRFTKKDLELIDAISSFAAVALEHARLYSECELTKSRLLQMHSAVSSSYLAAVVAKEMKDPLGIAKNYVRILADKLSADGVECEELAVISDEANRIASIIDQLLHFSEAYSEEPRDTPLNLLIENLVESMRQNLDAAGIETHLKLAKTLPQIWVIPNQMKMVFSNLIKLSVAEMPGGGTLAITARRSGASIRVDFSTTGIMHTREDIEELFLPSAVAKGLVPKGLGLYMAHNIIRGYGGDIEVHAQNGKGITFGITLPLDSGNRSGGVSH